MMNNIQLKTNKLNAESIQAPQIKLNLSKLPPLVTQAKSQQYTNKVQSDYSKTKVEVEDNINKAMFFDKNDPTQVNSVLDVLAKSMSYNTNGGKIFSLSTFWDEYKNMTYNRTIAPLKTSFNVKEGDKLTAADYRHQAIRNNMVSLGETADMYANLVKAMMPKQWTTAKNDKNKRHNTVSSRLNYAMGIGGKGERFSYDWAIETGNGISDFIVNLGLEIISDPLLWLKAGTEVIYKALEKEAIMSKFGETGINISEKEAKTLLNKYFKASAGESNWKDRAIKQFTGKSAAWDDFYKYGNVLLNNKFKAAGMNLPTAGTTNRWLDYLMSDVEERMTDRISLNILRGVRGASDVMQDSLSVLGSPAIFGGSELLRWGLGKGIKYIGNRLTSVKKKYTTDFGVPLKQREQFRKELYSAIGNMADVLNVSEEHIKTFLDEDIGDATYRQIIELNKFIAKNSDQFDKVNNAYKLYANLCAEVQRISGCDDIEDFCDNILKELQDGNSFISRMYDQEGLSMAIKNLKDINTIYLNKIMFEDVSNAMGELTMNYRDILARGKNKYTFDASFEELIDICKNAGVSRRIAPYDSDILLMLKNLYEATGLNNTLKIFKGYIDDNTFDYVVKYLKDEDVSTSGAFARSLYKMFQTNFGDFDTITGEDFYDVQSSMSIFDEWFTEIAQQKYMQRTDSHFVEQLADNFEILRDRINNDCMSFNEKTYAAIPYVNTPEVEKALLEVEQAVDDLLLQANDEFISNVRNIDPNNTMSLLSVGVYYDDLNSAISQLNQKVATLNDAYNKSFNFREAIDMLSKAKAGRNEKIIKNFRIFKENFGGLLVEPAGFKDLYTEDKGKEVVKNLIDLVGRSEVHENTEGDIPYTLMDIIKDNTEFISGPGTKYVANSKIKNIVGRASLIPFIDDESMATYFTKQSKNFKKDFIHFFGENQYRDFLDYIELDPKIEAKLKTSRSLNKTELHDLLIDWIAWHVKDYSNPSESLYAYNNLLDANLRNLATQLEDKAEGSAVEYLDMASRESFIKDRKNLMKDIEEWFQLERDLQILKKKDLLTIKNLEFFEDVDLTDDVLMNETMKESKIIYTLLSDSVQDMSRYTDGVFYNLKDFTENYFKLSYGTASDFTARLNQFKEEVIEVLKDYAMKDITIRDDGSIEATEKLVYGLVNKDAIRKITHNIDIQIDDLTRMSKRLESDEDIIELYINRASSMVMMTQGVLPEQLIEMDAPGGAFDQMMSIIETYPKGQTNEYVDHIADAINVLRDKVQEMKHVRAATERLSQMFPNKAMYVAALETLAGFNNADAKRFADEDYYWKFVNNMEANLTGKFENRVISQDAFRARYVQDLGNNIFKVDPNAEAAIKELFGNENYTNVIKRITKYGHDDPGADIMATMVIARTELGKNFTKYLKDKNMLGIDIETALYDNATHTWKATMNHDIGDVVQIGVYDPTSALTTVYRVKGVDSALMPGVRVEYFNTERDLLNKLGELFGPNTGKTRFFGFNNERYDMPFLMYRMEKYGISYCNANDFYNMCRNTKGIDFSYDVYKHIRLKDGVPQFSLNDYYNLKEFMETYAHTRTKSGYATIQNVQPNHIKKAIKALLDSLNVNGQKIDKNVEYMAARFGKEVELLSKNSVEYMNDINNKLTFGQELYSDISKVENSMELLYDKCHFPGETFDQFKVRFQNVTGRTEFSNMGQLLNPVTESNENIVNYRIVNRDFNGPAAGVAKGLFTKTPKEYNTISLSRVKYQRSKVILNQVNNYIKNVNGIYNIGYDDEFGEFHRIFWGKKDLFRQTDELVKKSSENSWVHWVDLDSDIMKTEAGRFALWNAYYSQGINKGLLFEKYPEIRESIRKHVFSLPGVGSFENTSIGIFDKNNLRDLIYEDVFNDSSWEEITDPLDRAIRFNEAVSYKGNKTARGLVADYHGTQAKNFISWFKDVPKKNQKIILDKISNSFSENQTYQTIKSLQSLVNGDGAYFMRDLMDSGARKEFSLNAVDTNIFEYEDLLNNIIKNKASLEKNYGLKIFVGPSRYYNNSVQIVLDSALGKLNYSSDDDIYTWLNKTYAKNENILANIFSAEDLDSIKDVLPADKAAQIEDMYKYAIQFGDWNTTGWGLNTFNFDQLYDCNLNEALSNSCFTKKDLISTEWFSKRRYYSLDGTPAAYRNRFTRMGNPLRSIMKNYMYAVQVGSARDVFTDYLCNQDSALHFDKLFRGLTDEQIAEIGKRSNNMMAIAPVSTKSNVQKYIMRYFDLSDISGVRAAREAGASIVPYQVYTEMFQAINNNPDAVLKINNKLLRSAMLAYKVGYLASPGTWLRNIIDSNLKAIMDTGDPLGMATNTLKAHQDLQKFTNTIELMATKYDLTDTSFNVTYMNRFYKTKGIEKLLKSKNCIETLNEFLDVYNALEFGPSIGFPNKVDRLLGKKDNSVLNTIAEYVLTPMGAIEQRVRLAQYYTLKAQGWGADDIYRKITDTAFDYSTKSLTDRYVEMVIPFYTFQKYNFLYWLNKFSSDSVVMNMLAKIFNISYDTFNMDTEELINNQSIRYALNSGAINVIDNATLKLSPSYMDAFNLMVNPPGILDSVWAPIKPALKAIPGLVKGIFTGAAYEGTKATLEKVIKETFTDPETYPWFGVFHQRYLAQDNPDTDVNEGSTANKNLQRIDNKLFKYLGYGLPDVFGSVNRWNQYKWNENLPDINKDSEGFFKALELESRTEEFKEMKERLQKVKHPTEKQKKFLDWLESEYFPYFSEKQKEYFEKYKDKKYDYYDWKAGLPDREKNPQAYYKAVKERSYTLRFKQMYRKLKSTKNPTASQQKFIAWIESEYFPYVSDKQKKYFEGGYYSKRPRFRKNYGNSYYYRKETYPIRNNNYYRKPYLFHDKLQAKIRAHSKYGSTIRVGSRYLHINHFYLF